MRIFTACSLLLIVASLASCSKEDTLPACTEGTIRFTCIAADPYDIFVDDIYKARVGGNKFIEVKVAEGDHRLTAKQASGYLLFPTEKTTTISVFGCEEKEWVFPK